jgi:RNA polymerase sigma-70 factor (ECF subfamily)
MTGGLRARRLVTAASAEDQADDEDVVERFEDFYLREFTSVVGLAFVLSGSSLAAEDLAQEAFMAAQRDWSRIGGYDNPGAWVRKVVANKAKNAFRNRARELGVMMRLALQWGVAPGVYELPGEHAEVWSAVRSLPKRQQQVVALHYLEGYTLREIAAALSIAEGTVKAHLHQGRTTLKQQLGDGTEPAE